jgi:hypothetical protein
MSNRSSRPISSRISQKIRSIRVHLRPSAVLIQERFDVRDRYASHAR